MPSSTTSFFALSAGALLTLPAAAATAPRELPGLGAVFSVLALGLGCTALGYMLYYRLIDNVGAERAAPANYLTPAFALLYGTIFLDGPVTASGGGGLVLIIAGAEVTARNAPGTGRAKAEMADRYRACPPTH